MRHAKSSWKQPGQDDVDRPLNRRGQRDAPRMAERLAAAGCAPELWLTSPAARARATAEALAGGGELRTERALYLADLGALLELVRELDDGCAHVALVGHNPGISQLAGLLTGEELGELPTCAVAQLALDARRWVRARPGCARLLELVAPERQTG